MLGKITVVVIAAILGWTLMGIRGLLIAAAVAAVGAFFFARDATPMVVEEPPLSRFLFENTGSAPLWLAIRILLGYEWLEAGLHKFEDPAWHTGEAILGFWNRAAAIPAEGRPLISFDWWRSFLNFMINAEWNTWFGPLIMYSEIAVGIALIIGLFTGLAALGGASMNWSFMMSGSASSNPMLFLFSVLVILAWRVAGWYGLDRWLLPILGTPWKPGRVFHQQEST